MKLNNELFTKHLQGMIKYQTVSNTDPDKMNDQEFFNFHNYLEATYPLLHKTLTKEIVGRLGLLYKWKGSGKSNSLPLLLTAHQDVVPQGDVSMWKYPPFDSFLDEDGVIWGRGTTDSKCNIQAYMDAIELLIADGFTPDFDLYLAFGYNEEIMGGPYAAAPIIVDTLKKRNVELGLVIDECGGIDVENGKYIATIYTCEKGYADFEFSKIDEGGHSAFPGENNALATIGKAAYLVQENPLPQKLTLPVIQELKANAPFVKGELGELFKDPEANWEKLKPLLAKDRGYNAMTRTTVAVTMAKGSEQANILPEKASIVANTRLLPGDTLDELHKYLKSIVQDDVNVKLIKGHNPSPVSSIESEGYKTIKRTVEKKYPDVTFIPSLQVGGTDCRYYYDICPTSSVYRFTGFVWNDKSGGAHQVNEHIDSSLLSGNVEFYINLISEYGK